MQQEPVQSGRTMLDTMKQHVDYDPETGHFYTTGLKYSNKPKGSIAGTVHKTKGYRYLTIKGKTYRAQRVAFLFMTGNWPSKQVDHINGIKDDNRWVNLRDVSPLINSENRGMWSTNLSGYKGVGWNKNCSKWQVLCRYKSVQLYKGLYEDVHEAGRIAAETYLQMKGTYD